MIPGPRPPGDSLDRRAAQQTAAFDPHAKLIPVRARCGDCDRAAIRRVMIEPGWVNIGPWTHADPEFHDGHPVRTVTFREVEWTSSR